MRMGITLALGTASLCFAGSVEVKDAAPMVHVPAGECVLGTTKAEAESLAKGLDAHPSLFRYETPQRRVSLPGFLIDKYPVTNRQFKRFVDATNGRVPIGWKNRSYPGGKGDHPVTGIVWQQADAYAKWAGKRLPTADEWEKAARGTDGRRYPWGNEWNPGATRIDDGNFPQTRALTTPVGCFPKGASPYGVMDLCGNVAEWTCTESRKSNPEKGWAWYVVKGASAAHCLKENFRCAAVNFSAHTSRWHTWTGFRCALDSPEPPAALPVDTTPERGPPPPKPCPGPLVEKYGTEPIRLRAARGSASVSFDVPFFPAAGFSLYAPEQSGAKGVPLSWGGGRPKLEWQLNEDQTEARYKITFSERAVQSVVLKSGLDVVDYTLTIRNLTDKPFTGVGSNSCFNNSASAYFEDMERARSYVWTDEGATRMLKMPVGGRGEPLHGGWSVAAPGQEATPANGKVRYPFIFIVSRDGKWVIAQAYGAGTSLATNAHYSCLHSRPAWPDIPPGEERSVTGRMYFLKGGPDDLLKRWKSDFAQ